MVGIFLLADLSKSAVAEQNCKNLVGGFLPADLRKSAVVDMSKSVEWRWEWGVHSATFDPDPRNELKNFSNAGGFMPQLLILK